MVDLSYLKQFTKGDSSKMKRYISMYLKIAPEIFKQMHTDLNNQDWSDLAIKAHSLKPQADFIGIKELKTILIQIENAVMNNDTSKIYQFYKRAFQIHQEAASYLKHHVDSL